MLSVLLAPFSMLYGLIARLRNFAYDQGWIKSYSFSECMVISVGNLSVGGTGKTPMIEYLIRSLLPRYSIAVLSRGYKRKTNGFRLANDLDDAATIGDEPFQFYTHWKKKIKVAVCKNRVAGINQLLKLDPKIKIVLLDDAFQHRRLKPNFSILLTEFSTPFFQDYILPLGRLREPRKGSVRADVVVVTKCKEQVDENKYQKAIQDYAGNKQVFFSSIKYLQPVPFEGNSPLKRNIVLATGIANSNPIVDYVKTNFTLIHHFNFNDHHDFSLTDIEQIQAKSVETHSSILVTEKDMVKLIAHRLKNELWFYLPIETYFLKSDSEFDKMLFDHVDHHFRSSLK